MREPSANGLIVFLSTVAMTVVAVAGASAFAHLWG